MKKWIIWVCAMLLLTACRQAPVARIYATLEGAGEKAVVLQKFNYNRMVTIDTIRTDHDGHFNYRIKLTGNAPYIYYLSLDEKPVASLVLLPSDQVTLTVPAEGPFTVEGSEESVLYQQANAAFSTAAAQINAFAASLTDDSPEAEIQAANRAMSKVYVDYKREAIKQIVSHPGSITSAITLFRRFTDNLPVFGQESDIVFYQTVLDSLSQVYPKTEYLKAIQEVLDARDKDLALSARFGDLEVISFPDLIMPDVEGKDRTLSDLKGQVIILSFWSVEQDEHKVFNVDLAELYAKYHAQGLEVYQVSLDADKPTWASVVRNQRLPWISVNDGFGTQSPALAAYNVDHIPTMFVFDRAGDIAARDLFERDDLEQQIRKLL
ncbi:MAG: AhpC/TSA family protein [Bacteroidales bacterium]|nr:AhpC/TSA family protein [Bacteroidales bacterium]